MVSPMPGLSPRSREDRELSRAGFVAVAVFVSLLSFAGAATAGGLVTSRDVKDRSLLSRDLKDGRAVTGADVRDGSLTARVLGPLPQGEQGIDGDPGPKGVDFLAGFHYALSPPQPIAEATSETWSVSCPPTHMAVGGGASASSLETELHETQPLDDASGWQVTLHSVDDETINGFAWAVCVEKLA